MFNLILTDGSKDIILPFKIRNTSIAKKWYKELRKQYPLYETDRFTNWGNKNILTDLNKHICTINEYDYIADVLPINVTQNELNKYHKTFEDLRGNVEKGTDWFNNAPDNIKHSVQQFNILIHKLEAELRTKKHPTVVVTFKDRPLLDLEQHDLKYFTYRWTSGTVYINYCQVGKTVLDVFKDKDTITEGIRPQKYYSADFMVKFGPTTPYVHYLLRKLYINAWLKLQPFKFKHPNIGMIPVGDIIGDFKKEELIKFNRVKEVECIV